MNRLLGIITLTKDNKLELERTIKSIINHKKLSLLSVLYIVDNSDIEIMRQNEELISIYRDQIKIIHIKESPLGIYQSMNFGLEKSEQIFSIFLNSGDEFYSEFKSDKIISLLKKHSLEDSDIDLIYCRALIKSTINKKLSYYNPSLLIDPTRKKFLLKLEPPSHQSCFFKTSWHVKNKYNTSLGYRADRLIIKKAISNSIFFNSISSIFYLDGISSINKASIKDMMKETLRTKSYRLYLMNPLKIFLKIILKNNWEYIRFIKHLLFTLIP